MSSENPEDHPTVALMGHWEAHLSTKHRLVLPSLTPSPLHPSGPFIRRLPFQAELQSCWPPYRDYVSLSSFFFFFFFFARSVGKGNAYIGK